MFFFKKPIVVNPSVVSGKTRVYRHPLLTLTLSVLFSANLGFALLLPYVLQIHTEFSSKEHGVALLMLTPFIFNIFLIISIMRWKKWAFYVYLLESLLLFAINLSLSKDIFHSVIYLGSIVLLYGALQLGGVRKGWSKLK